MGANEVWDKARELITVERVFGEPFEKDGTTIIPVAAVTGGGGGGGQDAAGGGQESAYGGGFGVSARPVGVYVIRDGAVEWQESTDTLRMMLGWQVVAIASVLAFRSMFKQRSKTKRRRG
jgi:uncharacterized spore protein YtfJ